ncbi:MAG: hypothetical protein ABI887_18775 [Burkholderiales bacterium]
MEKLTCAWALALATQASWALAPGLPSHRQAIEIGSCAGGPSIVVGADDQRALIDDTERDSLLAEMRARYPVLERDTFAPAVILLWHKPRGEWLYVSLQPNPIASGNLCFTATFVARLFRITPALASKYFS